MTRSLLSAVMLLVFYNTAMPRSADNLKQIAIHLSGISFVAAIAWIVGASHETVGTAIVVIGGIAVICWAVFGTLWWLAGLLFRRKDSRSADSESELRNNP